MKGKGNLCWERSPNSKGNFGPSVASPEFYFSSRRVIKAQWLVKSQSHKREKKKKASTNLLTALRCYCQHFLKRARGPCVYVYLFPAPGSTSKILMDGGVVRGGDQGQQTLGNEGGPSKTCYQKDGGSKYLLKRTCLLSYTCWVAFAPLFTWPGTAASGCPRSALFPSPLPQTRILPSNRPFEIPIGGN